jgi:hypothetical protein
MINASIAALLGKPLSLTDGKHTRSAKVSGPGSLGMGKFSPGKGGYLVNGASGAPSINAELARLVGRPKKPC